ncbi:MULTISPECIES: beta-ketoacyl-[acyl-carrier-protein] synthase family protein [unclassified Paenibacillus]|uniref:beta-ketoacyl-[acyl-carrier-protein] synthase family protein n=1 Tax=unclassified Paenibacillus TaxID=185978 RepID=UPI00020D6830|nr:MULTISPECIES: beta-ketoacyl-[acyl-carrier-protein] synthase family protein [unclassified Paenibacillus]EGL18384.1 putative 3-oxoacyl-(acyl carrier protein) synthase II [Paenibacillus sp. HGF7]EPD93493.1 hypothetical protein HMPREF1207_00059 [Paenibacillus sp. HGH0039]
MDKRVVITGYGVVTPFGLGEDPILDKVFEGKHCFRPLQSIDTSRSYTKVGGEAPVEERSYKFFTEYCTERALVMAGLDPVNHRSSLEKAAVAVGNLGDGTHLLNYYEQFSPDWEAEEFANRKSEFMRSEGDRPVSIHDSNPYEQAAAVAGIIGSTGERLAFTNACVASANAIGYGFDQVRKGRTPVAAAGGINVLYPIVFYNFDSGRAMAEEVVRPFSKHRSGLLIGDGAAILVLEELEHALSRGAEPLAEMIGWGLSSDGFHITQPDPEGDGLARSMKTALRQANCRPEEVDYINAHGTGTPLNDSSETNALKQVFGEYARKIPVSSTKSTTGHMLEATGAVEAIISVLALTHGRIPPTANFVETDEGLDLDYVTEGSRQKSLDVVMSNSRAFGGNNCTLLFRRWNGGESS